MLPKLPSQCPFRPSNIETHGIFSRFFSSLPCGIFCLSSHTTFAQFCGPSSTELVYFCYFFFFFTSQPVTYLLFSSFFFFFYFVVVSFFLLPFTRKQLRLLILFSSFSVTKLGPVYKLVCPWVQSLLLNKDEVKRRKDEEKILFSTKRRKHYSTVDSKETREFNGGE